MKTFILVRRDTNEIVSSKKFDSFDDARIERHKMEIANPDVIIDIFVKTGFQVGDKVKFNEETKKKFRTWLKTKDGFAENYTLKDMTYRNGHLSIMTVEEGLLGFDLEEIEYFETVTQER